MQKNVGFGSALVLFFRSYVDFTGRSTRAEYWWMMLWRFIYAIVFIALLIALVPTIIVVAGNQGNSVVPIVVEVLLLVLLLLVALASIVPTIALLVRRFRDAGVNPFLVLLPYLLPQGVGAFIGIPQIVVKMGTDDPATLFSTFGWQYGVYGLISLASTVFTFVVTVMPSTDKRKLL